ncbi:hypothetical protein L195_g009193 [Trifolium pratense]|uniref:Uncharacterized protein n=1 Tax=Trifolium pratense TaxID=57577 RepID=A0A2K3PB91_TRIPR|nr:hypothetical protein L195_g009193 [Trifolium pratense]
MYVHLVVGLFYPVVDEERLHSRFGHECGVLIYQYAFDPISLHFPLDSFEIGIMNHVKISPSQLHPLSDKEERYGLSSHSDIDDDVNKNITNRENPENPEAVEVKKEDDGDESDKMDIAALAKMKRLTSKLKSVSSARVTNVKLPKFPQRRVFSMKDGQRKIMNVMLVMARMNLIKRRLVKALFKPPCNGMVELGVVWFSVTTVMTDSRTIFRSPHCEGLRS